MTNPDNATPVYVPEGPWDIAPMTPIPKGVQISWQGENGRVSGEVLDKRAATRRKVYVRPLFISVPGEVIAREANKEPRLIDPDKLTIDYWPGGKPVAKAEPSESP